MSNFFFLKKKSKSQEENMKNETDSLKKNLFKSSEILIVDNQKKYDNREM